MPNSLPLYEDDMTGDTTARGYGWQHQARRARWAPRVAAGQVCCVRCGQLIVPGQPWDLGHDDYDRSITTGPEHRACNRSAAARKANATRRQFDRVATADAGAVLIVSRDARRLTPAGSTFSPPTTENRSRRWLVTVEEAAQALVGSLGDLTPEQHVLAALASRLARGLSDEAVAPYALAQAGRELRGTIADLLGAPSAGQGVSDREWDEFVDRLSTPVRWEEDG